MDKLLKFILPKRSWERVLKSRSKKKGIKYYETGKEDGWRQLLEDPSVDPILRYMMNAFESNRSYAMTSEYWRILNTKNVAQLCKDGFENFKQTISLNYFVWLVNESHPHMRFLKDQLSDAQVDWARKLAKRSRPHKLFTVKQSRLYNFMTVMLWKYCQTVVGPGLLERLSEPQLGNPPAIELEGRLVSQDLANSALEYWSMAEGSDDYKDVKTVVEMGAGFGRSAHVAMTLKPDIRYVIADIPPALYVSQRYLSEVFPGRKVFQFRDFDNFSEVENEFFDSQIAFLMPHQLQYLPDGYADLFVAIDCLHEMLPEQIEFYFELIDRVAKQFYFTCNKSTALPYADIRLTEKDYPVRPHWQPVFRRSRRVQTNYFETFFRLNKKEDETNG